MDFASIRRAAPSALLAMLLLSSCAAESTTAAAAANTSTIKIDRLIVRYELGAPPATQGGAPWGSQCVSDDYAGRLERGRRLGEGMRVIRVDPPVSPRVGRLIAIQMAQCPYIEWAEADETRLFVPGQEPVSG